MAKVVLKKVEKQYPNGFKAVHGIDLEINDGEFMVFVRSGGGHYCRAYAGCRCGWQVGL